MILSKHEMVPKSFNTSLSLNYQLLILQKICGILVTKLNPHALMLSVTEQRLYSLLASFISKKNLTIFTNINLLI